MGFSHSFFVSAVIPASIHKIYWDVCMESTPPYFNVERLLYYLSERIFNKTKVLGSALPGRDVRQDDFNVLKYVTVYDSAKLLTLFF